MRAFPSPVWLAAAVLVAGCATPRYQTTTRLELPDSPAAQPCLAHCEAASKACQSRCSEQREGCLKGIEPEVEKRYGEALQRYAVALDGYRADLERYRFDLWLRRGPGWWWYDPWPTYPMPFGVPRPPSREAISARVAKERCDVDCGCGSAYEGCVIGCGGHKVLETRCIANCPTR